MFALVDCNNFYVSCERAFNPHLENKPVVVLSNNDGCIISRSNEAKKLGIPMGAPFYQWQNFCKRHNVHVFSSNYELYGDMSQRIMTLLKDFNIKIEIYSIDEAFLLLDPFIPFLDMVNFQKEIKKMTGIPISIGVAPTKTLAKIANYIAKNTSNPNVFYLCEHAEQEQYLATIPIEKIWGIGHKLANKLKNLNIDSAKKLRDTDPHWLRLHFNVVLEKTVRELKGQPCLELQVAANRKQIICSRSFGHLLTELTDLEEAISHYTQIAAAKLRKQKSAASALYVFLQTNIHKQNQPQYSNAILLPLPTFTADTRYLIHIAKKCLRHIHKIGFQYNKAGVMLADLSPQQIRQHDLFMDAFNQKSIDIMAAIDTINITMGKNTIFFAAQVLNEVGH